MSEYRKKAEECLRAAERMRNPADRLEMLGIARGYVSLADHADRCRGAAAKWPHHGGLTKPRSLSVRMIWASDLIAGLLEHR